MYIDRDLLLIIPDRPGVASVIIRTSSGYEHALVTACDAIRSGVLRMTVMTALEGRVHLLLHYAIEGQM